MGVAEEGVAGCGGGIPGVVVGTETVAADEIGGVAADRAEVELANWQ